MVLAAGRGERMRPLTDHCPKPLLELGGKPLMQWTMEALVRGGFDTAVINTAWLGDMIEARFPAGVVQLTTDRQATATVPMRVIYSHEGHDFGAALETAGGITRALPHLADPFWVVAGDVYAPDFEFSNVDLQRFRASGALAHLWLVPNPSHNPAGDFALAASGLAQNDGALRHTYSTIGLFRHALFAPPYCTVPPGNPDGAQAALAPMLRAAVREGKVSAQLYTGRWTDVGTPQRLAQLRQAQQIDTQSHTP
ncbi:MAG: nucleotidyltransferase family protein [Anaerolineae bacterium]|nr:nucleotidyltransferase family protein [Anaerolineae bacterium]MCP5264388.1 nucleotidyltransferase family protein [Rhodoferax sp.]MCW5628436.1 nucleotidyltransferase family protein [Rhodoferax sp.]MCW5644075.1 nucleotidyltransferase family protein [Rhodoferax sp.]